MGVFRSRRRWGGLAALFALAIQLALSFGHIHAEELGVEPTLTAPADTGAPQTGHPVDDDDKVCGICAVMHLLGVAQAAAPPALPLPFAWGVAVAPRHAEARLIAAERVAFRSRAPPAA